MRRQPYKNICEFPTLWQVLRYVMVKNLKQQIGDSVMNQETYRYTFESNIPYQEIEDSLMLAVMAAESLHGRSPVRLDASFRLDTKKRSCTIDATEIGQAIARIFTGFLTREFGEESFKVERVTETHIPAHEQKNTEVTQGRT